jgi:broad specificity phosphatase PhoE
MDRRMVIAGMFLGLVAAATAAPGAPEPKALADLKKARRDAVQKSYEEAVAACATGRGSAEMVYQWSRRWLEAERDISDKKAERTAALTAHGDRMKALRQTTESAYR